MDPSLPPAFLPSRQVYPPAGPEFPEQSAEQAFIDRDILFHRALERLRHLRLQRGSPAPEAFLCHAHGDAVHERWVAREFAPVLRQAGIRVFLDLTDNGPGTSMVEFMDRILSVDHVLVIGTPLLYRKSQPGSGATVARELQRIVERLRSDWRKDSVIPVLLAGNEQASLPRVLWQRVYVDLREMHRYHGQMLDLILQMFGLLDDPVVQDWRYEIQDGRPLFR